MSQKGRQNTSTVLNAIAAFGEGYLNARMKAEEKERDVEAIENLDDPNLSPTQRAQIIVGMSKGGQEALSGFLTQQERAKRAAREDEVLAQRQQREGRLKGQNQKKDIQDMYLSRLKTIKDELNETYTEGGKKALKAERENLQKELGQNLERLKRGEEPRFEVLQIEEEPLPSLREQIGGMNQMNGFQDQASQQQQGAGNTMPTATQPKRVRWDKNNPDHAAYAAQVYESTGGDRAKTNAILAEQFER